MTKQKELQRCEARKTVTGYPSFTKVKVKLISLNFEQREKATKSIQNSYKKNYKEHNNIPSDNETHKKGMLVKERETLS